MYGFVLYTDGGAKGGNPGKGGSGIHGYLYQFVQPARGTGHPTHVLTSKGYVKKTEFKNQDETKILPKEGDTENPITEKMLQKASKLSHGTEVKIEQFIDRMISFPEPVTNNYAEVTGLIEAMKLVLAEERDVYLVNLYSDSTYVINGVTEWLPKWRAKQFRKPDGSLMPNAALWQQVDALLTDFSHRGITLAAHWVKGHNGDPGNEEADKLATMAIRSEHPNGLMEPFVKDVGEKIAVKGHFKSNMEMNAMFAHRYIMFNAAHLPEDGQYVTCQVGNKDGIRYLGSAHISSAYNIVQMKDTEYARACNEMVHTAMRKQQAALNGSNVICLVDTLTLFNKDFLSHYQKFGEEAFGHHDKGNREVFNTATNEVLVHVMRPQFLSYEAEKKVMDFHQFFSHYGRPEIAGVKETDITHLLYENKVDKRGNEASVLRAEWGAGSRILETMVRYDAQADGSKEEKAKVILTFGQDMLERNALKRLENYKPKVTVLTVTDCPYFFQYGVVCETDVGIVFSTASNSNARFIDRTENKNENSI